MRTQDWTADGRALVGASMSAIASKLSKTWEDGYTQGQLEEHERKMYEGYLQGRIDERERILEILARSLGSRIVTEELSKIILHDELDHAIEQSQSL